MRKITTACVIVLISMSQSSEPVRAQPDGKASETVAKNEQTNEEMSKPEPTMCEVPHTEAEDQALIETAIGICYSKMKNIPERYFINAAKLLEVETEMRIPESMRGMTLAAACVESGFNEKAEGDHRFSKDGKTPKAIGILQMWPCYEKAYGVNRKDVTSSAKGWLTHIMLQLPSVKKRCMPKDEMNAWRLAWVQGVRAPKVGGRCHENALHWYVFMRMKSKLTSNHT
jgi:hypothetical protein